jgi:hypothetical protein
VVVPLAVYWLEFFEEWLFTGVWRGGGTHEINPSPPTQPPAFPTDTPKLVLSSVPDLPSINNQT